MRKYFFSVRNISVFVFLFFILSCQTRSLNENQNPLVETEAAEVPSKYKLQEDRKKFEELRKEVPQQVKEENDEKALLLELTGELRNPPDRIREKFDSLKRKKRDLFERDLKSLRKDFTENERKEREVINAELKREKDAFKIKKASPEARKEFFSETEAKRKMRYADLRQKRDDFEADVREKRKDFEDYMRSKQSEFNQEMQIYRQRWQENERAKRKSSGQ